MKKFIPILLVVVAAMGVSLIFRSHAAENSSPLLQHYEYATIRWGGRDNTHVIRPSGNVEFVGNQLVRLRRPEHADDRSFYMNGLMNALAKEGYEFAGMTSDEIVMRRGTVK
jgi:hypothetical protein